MSIFDPNSESITDTTQIQGTWNDSFKLNIGPNNVHVLATVYLS